MERYRVSLHRHFDMMIYKTESTHKQSTNGTKGKVTEKFQTRGCSDEGDCCV